ncbi:hypothetical protein F511_12942 [Dorcoceras hygrometricum]|uniref:Uncharacterized protein n=1 Tax=Dorcoceras hygrometricum TaxID=472368 RepID=A0A2Z7CBY5_9LAMI|nr:hypothetical protein F511_12942 [Dorcoceras hygrometricum]
MFDREICLGSGSDPPARQRKNKEIQPGDDQYEKDTASRGPTTIAAPESQFRTCPTDHGKASSNTAHDPLGITDSACKNQSVVVSVQYGPFNPYIPIRSTTIGKSRVARDPIAMHTSWRSNSDIASVTRPKNLKFQNRSKPGPTSHTGPKTSRAARDRPEPNPRRIQTSRHDIAEDSPEHRRSGGRRRRHHHEDRGGSARRRAQRRAASAHCAQQRAATSRNTSRPAAGSVDQRAITEAAAAGHQVSHIVAQRASAAGQQRAISRGAAQRSGHLARRSSEGGGGDSRPLMRNDIAVDNRQSGRLLRQAALESLTNSARTDSPRRIGWKQISGEDRRRRRRRVSGGGGGGEGREAATFARLAVGPQPLRLRNHHSRLAQRIMVKRLATSPHDHLGITDSACKNQSVVVSVQYGPFNPYIPIRSTTIGKSRVAIDPIAMHTSWRSNSDIASVTSIGYPRMSASGESSTTMHRLLHASGSHPIPTPYDPK